MPAKILNDTFVYKFFYLYEFKSLFFSLFS